MSDNPYRGVNAHLNSLLQTAGTREQPAMWKAFHQFHISQIVIALNRTLPRHYIAFSEQALQVDLLYPNVESFKPTPDVSIFQRSQPATVNIAEAPIPTRTLNLGDLLDLDDTLDSAVIREVLPQRKLGAVIARFELLSPSNKPNGTHYDAYEAKRIETFESGVPLIEIDYLHEQSPLIRRIPRYPRDPAAFPYMTIVTDPRPEWQQGTILTYEFGVNELIKPFLLPLKDDESLIVDLDTIYQTTLNDGRWNEIPEYTQPPDRFDSYRADDQAQIRAIMAAHNATP
ncbi:MAG: DUF4058 family protein [Chloroflexota bacterium]|nr:DUF4058 family protein [Chloroflexota bacterium]